MKNNALKLIALAFILFPMALNAQSPMDKLFDKFAGQEGYTSVNISKDMFQMFANMADPKDTSMREMKKMMDNLTGMKVLTCKVDSVNPAKSIAFYKEASQTFPGSAYGTLMTINEDGQDIKFLYRPVGGEKINEFVMLAKGKHEVAAMSLTGVIDLTSVSKLSKVMNLHGMEGLQRMRGRHMDRNRK
ncbi:MAG: DUF4252 domain-containing protein [Bacteroidetes bacterium]|nr:DUF4252 domain-containing protein [Bacteroidota bacterium]